MNTQQQPKIGSIWTFDGLGPYQDMVFEFAGEVINEDGFTARLILKCTGNGKTYFVGREEFHRSFIPVRLDPFIPFARFFESAIGPASIAVIVIVFYLFAWVVF